MKYIYIYTVTHICSIVSHIYVSTCMQAYVYIIFIVQYLCSLGVAGTCLVAQLNGLGNKFLAESLLVKVHICQSGKQRVHDKQVGLVVLRHAELCVIYIHM